ncbi:MAG: EAL domain-containing protein [Micavibrio sp.]|nr:EAL domain-containing protein [Micavibrio sp.]
MTNPPQRPQENPENNDGNVVNNDDNVVDLVTRLGVRGFQAASAPGFRQHLTFRNIVLALGLATFLIFIGSVVSGRTAFLFASLFGLAAALLFEMSSRRRWESQMNSQFRQVSGDYERLVREVARHRNDMMVLKKSLADAGTLARSYGMLPGGEKGTASAVEQRMIKALADQLSKLDARADSAGAEMDFSAIATPAGVAPEAVGRNLTDAQVLQIVKSAVNHDRIDLFLQPIVNLPQRKVRFFELFSRIRIKPEIYLPAERYIEVAMRQDLVASIDNLLLLRGLQLIRDTSDDGMGAAFFCNITSITLNDPKFMNDLVEFIAQNRALAPRLVFELGQRDLAAMNPDALPVLEGLSRLGCRFSMDQVKSLSFDYAHLDVRHIRFIKVDVLQLLRELRETGGLSRMKRLKAELDTRGIDIIVEKIESDRQQVELLDLEIDYGQGYLFGKPVHSSEAFGDVT